MSTQQRVCARGRRSAWVNGHSDEACCVSMTVLRPPRDRGPISGMLAVLTYARLAARRIGHQEVTMTDEPSHDTPLAGPELGQIVSVDPATGEVVGRFPLGSTDDVHQLADRAQIAAQWWTDLGPVARRERLLAWAGVISRGLPRLAELVHRENGKPNGDAVLEIVAAVDHLAWAAKNAARVLHQRRRPSGLLGIDIRYEVAWLPYGVVGVIGPWNYPVLTPMGSLAFALAAGNAVIFKPSEFTPAVGDWLVDAFAQVVPEQPVLSLLTGDASTGAALCRAGVNKIAFTGSTTTAKKVMAACAESLTPVLLECGGKDAIVVAEDADIKAAADAAVWGAMSNGGQTCIGIERAYVAAAVYDQFLAEVQRRTSPLRPGSDPAASYGPITMPSQRSVIARHVADALSRGGKAVVGGEASIGEHFVSPIVLVDVPEDSSAILEETFGPTLTILRVRDGDEAVDRANATSYGLGGSVYSKHRGAELAARMRAGMVSVNSVMAFAFGVAVPFGGVGDSGFGRIHGPEGLKEFAWPKTIATRRLPVLMPIVSFDRQAATTNLLTRITILRHGRRT